jgi:ADP-ribose pyrophosphatase YjhB (NUDIX family)
MEKFNFCPKCGSKLISKKVRTHQRLVCGGCGFVFYQNPKPAAGVFIVEGKKVLLAKRAVHPLKGYWDSVGGFVEAGESPQETALRETKEETGLDIKITEVLGVGKDKYEEQETTVIGLLAEIIKGKPESHDDVSELKWFSLDHLPENIAFESNKRALGILKTKIVDS